MNRHPGESRDPGFKHVFTIRLTTWAPAFAGATATALLCLMFSVPLHADQLGNLIEGEKKDRDAWTQDAEELPPAYLWGDKTGVELASPLCEAVPFDELIELSRGRPTDRETVLNLDIPRVREIIEQLCVVRPNDRVMAVTESGTKWVAIKDFVVRSDRRICPEDSAYALWGTFSEALSTAPIFFSTYEDWKETSTVAVPLVEGKPQNDERKLRARLSEIVWDQAEFNLSVVPLTATNADDLVVLRRKNATLEDDDLPNEILLRHKGDLFEKIWTERVDSKKGSGHLQAQLSLDYNGDGFVDLVLSGYHEGCPYTMVLEGWKEGFHPVNLPPKFCTCP